MDDNYLVFADKYWRIIRINEDGSVRVIYSGDKATVDAVGKETVLANGYNDGNTDYTQIQTSAYNSNVNRSEYVGFTYTEGLQRPSDTESGDSSTIKGVLDTWYNNNLQTYDNMIVSTPGFCNDRNTASYDSWVSTGAGFDYAAYERVYTTHQPSFECNDNNDLYQTKIGLITADEAAYAGGKYELNDYDYYLYTGNSYWTMSPRESLYNFQIDAFVFLVLSSGVVSSSGPVSFENGVRPVINISSNVTVTGSGTIQDPYIIETT